MKREELVEKLPEVLNRLEGKGPGSRSGKKVDAAEDLLVFASFLKFAAEQAIANGEVKRGSSAPVTASAAPFVNFVGDDEETFNGLRVLVGNNLEVPKLVASRDIPLEDAGKTNRVVGGLEVEPIGQESRRYDAAVATQRAPVTIPIPDDPQNVSEWLPLVIWGLPKLQKLIARLRGK
jgi:hypothetical protein